MESKKENPEESKCLSLGNILADSAKLYIDLSSAFLKNVASALNQMDEINKKYSSDFNFKQDCACEFPKLERDQGRFHKWYEHFYCSNPNSLIKN